MHLHCTILTNSPYTHTCRIAAFEESLKTWNPRPEIPDEPCEDMPDWMDDVDNLGSRVVKSVNQIEIEVQEASRNIKIKTEAENQKRAADFVMPKAVKINSKPWSSKDTSAKSKASQGKTPHHEMSYSMNKKPTSSSEEQMTKEKSKANPERCAKETSSLASCDISPPVEDYFGKEKPEIEKGSKAGESVKIAESKLDIPVAPVDSKVKSNKKKKGNKNTEKPEAELSKVEPVISGSSAKEAAEEEKESAKPKEDAKSVSNTDAAESSPDAKIKAGVKTAVDFPVDESPKVEKTRKKGKKEIVDSSPEDCREISSSVAVSQAEITLKVKPSKEATPEAEAAAEEIPVEKCKKKKGKEKKGSKSDDNSTSDTIVGARKEVKPNEGGASESEVAAEGIPADKSKKKKGKGQRAPENDDNSTIEVHTEVKPRKEGTPESEVVAEEIPADKSNKKKGQEKKGHENDDNSTVEVQTDVKPRKEATPESEAASEEIPAERRKKKKGKEKRGPESDENSSVDSTVGVHTEVRPRKEATPESGAAAEEIPMEKNKKKKGKEKRGPESDKNSSVDSTVGIHTEVKPGKETTPECEAAVEEIPVEKNKKKKSKEKREPESDEKCTVAARSDSKLKTTSKDAEPIKTQEQKVKSPATAKTNPWGNTNNKATETKESERDDKCTVDPPASVSHAEIKLMTENKDAETSKTQEQSMKPVDPVKTNPWSKSDGKGKEKKEPERDDDFPPVSVARTEIKQRTGKDTEASKKQEQKQQTVDRAKCNPWGKSDVTISAKEQSKKTSNETVTSIDVKSPGDRICVEGEEVSGVQTASRAKSQEKEPCGKVNDEMNQSMASSQIGWSESSGKRVKPRKRKEETKMEIILGLRRA